MYNEFGCFTFKRMNFQKLYSDSVKWIEKNKTKPVLELTLLIFFLEALITLI